MKTNHKTVKCEDCQQTQLGCICDEVEAFFSDAIYLPRRRVQHVDLKLGERFLFKKYRASDSLND